MLNNSNLQSEQFKLVLHSGTQSLDLPYSYPVIAICRQREGY